MLHRKPSALVDEFMKDFYEVYGRKQIQELFECVRNVKRGSQLRTRCVSFCRRRTTGANEILTIL
jgi:hypothetical protein